MKTRIKVIRRGDKIRYVPQSKGFIDGWSNRTIGERCLILFIPLIGQIYLLGVVVDLIISLFWTVLHSRLGFNCDFDSGTEEYAKSLIDYHLCQISKAKTSNVKKEISYIKYP